MGLACLRDEAFLRRRFSPLWRPAATATETASRPLWAGAHVRDDFTAMQGRLDQLFNTSFTPPDNAIPASGTAEFRGFMKVDVAGTTPST
jgi:hypothetical protein